MDKTQPQAPEPLNLTTALASMKAINMIFQSQYGNLFEFEPLRISSPFVLTDFVSLENDVIDRTGTKDQLIIDKLKAIGEYAALNIQLFDKIKAKKFEDRQIRCYRVNEKGQAFPANELFADIDLYLSSSDYPQLEDHALINLQVFCKQVHEFIVKCLANPMEAKPRIQPVASEAQKHKAKDEPTTPQIALFFYYLVEGKHIQRPVASDFRIKNFHKENPYDFNCSGQKVYQIFNHPKAYMNERNLSKVISMLAGYPGGKVLAQNDFYSIRAE